MTEQVVAENLKANQLIINELNETEMDEKSPLMSVQNSTDDAYSQTRKQSSSRQPFIHNSMQNLLGKPEDIDRSAIYHRYKYIAKLSGHSTHMATSKTEK
ncbi:hypothetical protein AC249_AIPGENE20154 [Exaiptasia diaphana]|nr:hypothetical protein AC249_AIPGENE20154 [Exaiptasia diaphana]